MVPQEEQQGHLDPHAEEGAAEGLGVNTKKCKAARRDGVQRPVVDVQVERLATDHNSRCVVCKPRHSLG